MSHSRHHAREVALQVLYRFDVDPQAKEKPSEPHLLSAEIQKHFDHFQVTPAIREFSARLVAGTLLKCAEIDQMIEKVSANWKLSRMAVIDRNLLRMSCYELLFMKDTPQSVTLDEAVELAKQFGTAETPAFVNGVLDQIRKNQSIA